MQKLYELGSIIWKDNRRYRVIDINNSRVILIDLESGKLFNDDIVIINTLLNMGNACVIEEPQKKVILLSDLSDADRKKVILQRDKLEEIIETYYPNLDYIFVRGHSNEVKKKVQEELGISRYGLERLLKKYLMGGRTIESLIDQRKNNGGHCTRSNSGDKGIGRSVIYTPEEIHILQVALEVFKKSLSAQAAYEAILGFFYRVDDVSGQVRLVDEKNRISYGQIRRYICEQLGIDKLSDFVKKRRTRGRDDRVLSGSAQYGILAVGAQFQVDECELPVYLVSDKDPSLVIGKAIMYAAVDTKSNICVACHVGLKNNSFSGFTDMMMTLLEPHDNQTRKYGVHVNQSIFPSEIMPKEIICDHGAEYESAQLARACSELGISVSFAPIASGSLKGLIENLHKRVQDVLRPLLVDAGYVVPDEYKATETAKKLAKMTISDLQKIVFASVVYINQAVLPSYELTPDMIKNNVEKTPAAIYKYAVGQYDPVNVCGTNRARYFYALLSTGRKFVVTKKGLCDKQSNLIYYSDDAWFLSLLNNRNKNKLDVRINPHLVDKVYVRYNGVVHEVGISPKRPALLEYKGMSWSEVDKLMQQAKSLLIQTREASLARKIALNSTIDKVSQSAGLLQGKGANNIKDIKSNRQAEMQAIEMDNQIIKDRLLMDNKSEIKPANTHDDIIEYEYHPGEWTDSEKDEWALAAEGGLL